ncbi:hypothetical protein K1719_021095 [Acacia pycnantha]|nr:hypothetical protein K1719_021095 [Acacia pycnantha]
MENNLPVISKRVWSIVRIALFTLRKGFTKRKLLMGLNLMLKRPGKLAGKAFANLISHHHHCHHGSFAASQDAQLQFSTAREYEFSCSNTPKYGFITKRHIVPRHFLACAHAPLTVDEDTVAVNNVFNNVVMEMLNDKEYKAVVEASPALAATGRTRTVRVTVQDGNDDGDNQIDKAAEEFIERFFMELRKQG